MERNETIGGVERCLEDQRDAEALEDANPGLCDDEDDDDDSDSDEDELDEYLPEANESSERILQNCADYNLDDKDPTQADSLEQDEVNCYPVCN